MIGVMEWIIFLMAGIFIGVIIIILRNSMKKPATNPPPPCPNCNTGMQFINQHGKWYCDRCNRYY